MNAVIVSHSEVDQFLRCERSHYYAYAGGGLQRKKQSDALTRGTLGHSMLEVFFQSLKDGLHYDAAKESALQWHENALVESASTGGNELAVLAKVGQLVPMFIDYYRQRILQWEILYVEETFFLSLSDRIRFPFKPDLIVREKGFITVIDYKFKYNFYTAAETNLLGQVPKYVGALRAIGIDARKGLYAQLRTREMKEPSYANLLKMEEVPLNTARIQNTFKNQITVTERIAEYKELPVEEWDRKATRVLNEAMCGFCSFQSLCTAELNGSDGRIVRMAEYEKNTYGYKEVEE